MWRRVAAVDADRGLLLGVRVPRQLAGALRRSRHRRAKRVLPRRDRAGLRAARVRRHRARPGRRRRVPACRGYDHDGNDLRAVGGDRPARVHAKHPYPGLLFLGKGCDPDDRTLKLRPFAGFCRLEALSRPSRSLHESPSGMQRRRAAPVGRRRVLLDRWRKQLRLV